MSALRRWLDGVLGWVLVVLMGASVLNVLWQVFSRYVLRHPSSTTEELARFLLIWVGLLGAAYAAGKNQHLAIDLLPTHLSGRRKAALQVVIELAILVFAVAIMLYGGTKLVLLQLKLGQTSAALGVKLGHVYLAIPISGAVMTLYALMNLVRQPALSAEGHSAKEVTHGLE